MNYGNLAWIRATRPRAGRYASLPQNVWTQQWNVGDVIIWDNRRVLHRRDAFPDHMRRMMRRCQVLARERFQLPGEDD